MRFTDAYAVPLCSPTRASILSDQYSSRHRVTSATGHQQAAPAGASPYPPRAAANQPLIYANSKHYLDLDLVTHLNRVAHAVACAQHAVFAPARIGLMIAGFEVPHTHLHVIPIDGMSNLDFATADTNADSAELDEVASLLRRQLIEDGFGDEVPSD